MLLHTVWEGLSTAWDEQGYRQWENSHLPVFGCWLPGIVVSYAT